MHGPSEATPTGGIDAPDFPWVRIAPSGALVSGCARPAVLQTETPAPARPVSSVEVLLDVPERPFRTVALIRSPHENLFRDVDTLKRQVVEKAAELGADAVILSFSGVEGGANGTGITSSGEIVFVGGGSSAIHVSGRAIRYTDAPPKD